MRVKCLKDYKKNIFRQFQDKFLWLYLFCMKIDSGINFILALTRIKKLIQVNYREFPIIDSDF